MAAPKGNQYAKNGARWRKALERSLARLGDNEERDLPQERALERGLDQIADTVVKKALAGGKDEWMEIATRLDGKVTQSVEIGEDPDNPLPTEIVVRIVRPGEGNIVESTAVEHSGENGSAVSIPTKA